MSVSASPQRTTPTQTLVFLDPIRAQSASLQNPTVLGASVRKRGLYKSRTCKRSIVSHRCAIPSDVCVCDEVALVTGVGCAPHKTRERPRWHTTIIMQVQPVKLILI